MLKHGYIFNKKLILSVVLILININCDQNKENYLKKVDEPKKLETNNGTTSLQIVNENKIIKDSKNNENNFDFQNLRVFLDFAEQFFRSINDIPLSSEIKTIRNVHDENQIDEIYTVKYIDFNVQYYYIKNQNKKILLALKIGSSVSNLPFGVKIGDSQNSIVKILGKPLKIENNLLIYEINEYLPETLVFEFIDKKLDSVKWVFATDWTIFD